MRVTKGDPSSDAFVVVETEEGEEVKGTFEPPGPLKASNLPVPVVMDVELDRNRSGSYWVGRFIVGQIHRCSDLPELVDKLWGTMPEAMQESGKAPDKAPLLEMIKDRTWSDEVVLTYTQQATKLGGDPNLVAELQRTIQNVFLTRLLMLRCSAAILAYAKIDRNWALSDFYRYLLDDPWETLHRCSDTDFHDIDITIAESLGIPEDDPRRLRAAVLYTMRNLSQRHGDTVHTHGRVARYFSELVGPICPFAEVVQDLLEQKKLYAFRRDGTDYYTEAFYVRAAEATYNMANPEWLRLREQTNA